MTNCAAFVNEEERTNCVTFVNEGNDKYQWNLYVGGHLPREELSTACGRDEQLSMALMLLHFIDQCPWAITRILLISMPNSGAL